jgi:hypothetical protein
MRLALLLAAALMLAACSPKADTASADAPLQVDEMSVVTDPAAPEPQVDPTELDLSQIALAMRIPSAFRAYDDGAALQINLISPRLGVDIAENFPLVITRDVESPFLTSELKDGFSIWTFGTRAEDSTRLAALSAEVARLKVEAPGENELTFGALAPGCWAEPEQTPGSLARTLYIRVVPTDDFQVFVPEQVLAEGDIPGIETYWGACEE